MEVLLRCPEYIQFPSKKKSQSFPYSPRYIPITLLLNESANQKARCISCGASLDVSFVTVQREIKPIGILFMDQLTHIVIFTH